MSVKKISEAFLGVGVDDTGTLHAYSRDGTGYREYGIG